MGRGKVELKRIENRIHRQVSFSKRRSGLVKKAHEISVLCEAHVALIVFSTKGRLYDYSSSHSSMDWILERYESHSCAEKALAVLDVESRESLCADNVSLKAKLESLQKCQRHLMGEQLEMLNVKRLQQLEHQLQNALKNVRSRKNQLLLDSLAELRIKEKELQDHNRNLKKIIAKAKTKTKALTKQKSHREQQQGQPLAGSSSPPTLQVQDVVPSLNIRIYTANVSCDGEEPPVASISINGLPAWMIHSYMDR